VVLLFFVMNNRIWLAALMLFALAQGLAYVFIVPVWQAPDEPMLYEYAALVTKLGRIPRAEDHNAALEQRMADSLARQGFWRYRRVARNLAVPPRTMDGVLALFPMPRQVGGDPPLYFALAALPLRLVAGWSPERQVLLLRLLNALLLPCIVACAYGAAREIFLWPTTDHSPRIEDRGWKIAGDRSSLLDPRSSILDPRPLHPFTPSPLHFPLAAAALVAFHPMLAVIGASLSNDGPANFFGAGLCWATLRLLRCGITLRRVALAAGLLCLGLLTKRTMLPYLPLLLVLGLGWVLTRRPWHGRLIKRSDHHRTGVQLNAPTADGYRGTARPVLHSSFFILHSSFSRWLIVAAVLVFVALWTLRQFDYQRAAVWMRYGSWQASARVWPADQPDVPAHGAALRLAAGEMNFQPLPAVGADLLRGRPFRFGARIWSPVPARGRLIVETGDGWHEWPFEVHGQLSPEAAANIAKNAHGVWFGIAADSGWFYADDLWATGQDMPTNLLTNGGSELPALATDSPLRATVRYLRLPDVVWTLRSGHISDPLPRGGDWVSVFFISFWGHFGWMDVPFVFGTLWIPILVLLCLVGGLGTLGWLLWRRGQVWQRRQVWALLLLLVFAISLPIINAYSVPLSGALQQGRYIFPVLVPLAIVIALGQSALVPARWQRVWLWLWLGFWAALACAALLRLVVYYHL
jgi:hypothetical protein